MAKKSNFSNSINRLFTVEESEQVSEGEPVLPVYEDAEVGERLEGKPGTEKTRDCRFNLKISSEIKEYLANASWTQHMSMTEYINQLIIRDMENTRTK